MTYATTHIERILKIHLSFTQNGAQLGITLDEEKTQAILDVIQNDDLPSLQIDAATTIQRVGESVRITWIGVQTFVVSAEDLFDRLKVALK